MLTALALLLPIVLSGCIGGADSLRDGHTRDGNAQENAAKGWRGYAECSLGDDTAPETTAVILSGVSMSGITQRVEIEDLLGIYVTFSQIEGRVGSPVDITFSDVEKVILTFEYDPSELRGVPPENLMMLHYDNEYSFPEEVESTLNSEEHTISAHIDRNGVYVLVDAYRWYGGCEQYAYGANTADYESDWERERDTGSIMELADPEWALENGPDFDVYSPEDLASVVYYANSNYGPITINIEEDIDLTGYDWCPMGWYSVNSNYGFMGSINGNGHTINGMHIDTGYIDAGFIGYGTDLTITDLSFTNAYVSGNCTGIVGGEVYGVQIENVSVQGVVEGGTDSGSIIGRDNSLAEYVNCSVDVTVDGEIFPYYSHRDMLEQTVEAEETFTITVDEDLMLTRDEHDGFSNLGWNIAIDGQTVLCAGAERSVTFSLPEHIDLDEGESVVVYLEAYNYDYGFYCRVSNIIEFEYGE